MTLDLIRYNAEAIREYAARHNPEALRREIELIQVAVFTMAGGGVLGGFAATQPAQFYIDDRVGKLPYGSRAIENAVKVLATLADAAGLDPKALERPRFHNLGVF